MKYWRGDYVIVFPFENILEEIFRRPDRKARTFYTNFANRYRTLEPNLIYQWKHRAKKLGEGV